MPRISAHLRPRRRRAAVAAIAVAASLTLAACSSPSTTPSASSTEAADYGDINVQLSWLKNQEFAGYFFAEEKGYFGDAGFGTVTLTSGGSTATGAEAAVTSGQAFAGISSPLITAPAILKGAPVKIVAADYQKNPFAIVSATAKPIASPKDLVGKTIAVSDSNQLVWKALLAANKIDPSEVKTVPFTATSQLTTGQVDGYIGYTTSGANALNAAGFPATEFLLADNGLPLVSETVVVTTDTIKNHRAELKAFLKAIVQGWKAAQNDPQGVTNLVTQKYGVDQGYKPDAITRSMAAQTSLVVTDDTEANGLLTVTKTLQKQTVASLKLAGVTISASKLFDLSPLDEVLAENPDLK